VEITWSAGRIGENMPQAFLHSKTNLQLTSQEIFDFLEDYKNHKTLESGPRSLFLLLKGY
jgi:hypothetical protein